MTRKHLEVLGSDTILSLHVASCVQHKTPIPSLWNALTSILQTTLFSIEIKHASFSLDEHFLGIISCHYVAVLHLQTENASLLRQLKEERDECKKLNHHITEQQRQTDKVNKELQLLKTKISEMVKIKCSNVDKCFS